ncbi:3-mercaptopyruvate sulfurtransferase [Sphingobium sp. 22B]|uniref:sulfurtransferase n=1 Tax=unclassified Sphingobium TaxID=2611147 RepID=UPI00078418E1|nr:MULTISPECIES: sulfurtransferase [unclassified Sphingobium]KXU31502.1 3-mercaptopyruvate sulfurtransferase [Sphingobium sp. AM]KYC31156.1 3-mercaptopyruvate sulfurtransferase [Sphingobium sp. 22B]OAP31157.1 3-mercaptopyruvate sulfurtransferase [Sphingobium sp. 20006FA]
MTYTTLISATDLAPLVAAGDVVLFDCEFDLAAPAAGHATYLEEHLPGARYLHLDADLSSAPSGTNGRHPLPDPAVFQDKMRAAGVMAGQQVVAYDSAGGPYAARAWWLLRWLGHKAVAVLDGGKAAWLATGQALESGEPAAATPGNFTATATDPAATVSADDVLANIGGDRLVIDARTAERWRGEPSPLDPVSGHIPGAGNRWFKDNLAADGSFKSADALAADWRAVMGEKAPEALILQCGSGVTACHNALALEVAGLPGAVLYPGSWSEWISDPTRPVEKA